MPTPADAGPDAAWFRALARAMKLAYAERLSGLGDAEPIAAESCSAARTRGPTATVCSTSVSASLKRRRRIKKFTSSTLASIAPDSTASRSANPA